jgi:photosystem II stability/assembly factor-like uncharacterized protein
MSRALLPFFLFTTLMLVLAACGSTTPAATPTPTPIAQATVQATTPPSQATPSPTTGTTQPVVPLTGIRMLDTQIGWALTASSILKTTDGGAHWQDVTPANAGMNQYAKGDFFNGQYAWIAVPPPQQIEGSGITILHTTNGGSSWQSAKINDPLVSIIDVPHFLNAQQGWLEASSTPGAGHAGSDIWHSTDGGQTWAKIASNGGGGSGLTLGYVTGISFQNTLTGIATGNLGAGGDNSLPSISMTHDGGKTWKLQSLPHLLGGYDVIQNNTEPPVFFGNTVVLPVDIAIVNGNLFALYRSNNGGQTWFQTSVVHIRLDNTYVLDSTHAWANDAQSGQNYSTANGGTTWITTSTTAYHLKALSFTDASTGWGITSQALLHTADGGKTWQQISYSIG